MKLLYLLLILIIIIVLVYNSTKITDSELQGKTESELTESSKTIPRITYDDDGTVNTLPVINKLPLQHISNPLIPDETRERDDVDLLIQSEFNMDKMNPNRWNYGKPDFAPYIDGSLKQNTNNYVPGYKFNSNQDFTTITDEALHDVKINAWRNKSDDKKFLVQCS